MRRRPGKDIGLQSRFGSRSRNARTGLRLDARYIKTRKVDGQTLPYIEGWHAIAEVNRLFGFDA